MTQVISEEKMGLSFRFKKRYNGLKIPVITAARTITDKNGHKSQPNKKQETRKMARKNHNIVSRGVELFKASPETMRFQFVSYKMT